jgi:catechol 2,3-dioxygenase-like lactoylglutathione lyase family enzyme
VTAHDVAALAAARDRLPAAHLQPRGDRPVSSGRGLHHAALISSDVERTIRFAQDLLEFPLTELIENRDYPGSSHFFFDIGNRNLLAFFDFPGLDVGKYADVLGGLHHVSISVEPESWRKSKDKFAAAGVPHEVAARSLFISRPGWGPNRIDGDPLCEMYGNVVR